MTFAEYIQALTDQIAAHGKEAIAPYYNLSTKVMGFTVNGQESTKWEVGIDEILAFASPGGSTPAPGEVGRIVGDAVTLAYINGDDRFRTAQSKG